MSCEKKHIITELEDARKENNSSWMDLMRLAEKYAPENEFKDVMRRICNKDAEIIEKSILENIRGEKIITGTCEVHPYKETSPAESDVSDGMVLVRKSSMLEPNFEKMGRQILDQAKQIKGLVDALKNIKEFIIAGLPESEVAEIYERDCHDMHILSYVDTALARLEKK